MSIRIVQTDILDGVNVVVHAAFEETLEDEIRDEAEEARRIDDNAFNSG